MGRRCDSQQIQVPRHEELIELSPVIRDIEDADEHWDPVVRKRKDRQAASMPDGQPSTSLQDESTAGVGSTESNLQSAIANINNSKSIPRGFY